MPSSAPRITIYTDQATYDAFSDAATVLGTSRSKLLGDLARSAVPVMAVLTDAATTLRSASEKQGAAMSALAEHLAVQVEDINGMARDFAERVAKGDPPSLTGGSVGVSHA